MNKLLAALISLVAALTFGAARASADGVVWGVNDNAGLYAQANVVPNADAGSGAPDINANPDTFWTKLGAEGLKTDTITLRWNERTPDGFDGADGIYLDGALQAAQAAGTTIELDVYPRHANALFDPAGPKKFAAFLTKLAQTYPQVTQYVVMNECNQDLFVNPQWSRGHNVSAARCGSFLAAGYDALKAVDPTIFVWGLGLSPRGNLPGAGKPSTNPIDWLGYLGRWYRASGRTAPLMDGLDIHPYPVPQSLPFATGYRNPRAYSVTNLPRVYQAFYDAFEGSPQTVVGLLGRLPVQLNEVGIQTSTRGRAGYTGTENAATPNGGLVSPFDSERYQARWYMQLVDFAECDADIRSVNIFKLVDEPQREGWQSGLFYAGWVPKASAGAVRNEIARLGGRCPRGNAAYWTPLDTYGAALGARAAVGLGFPLPFALP